MADYFTPTVVDPVIPLSAMLPIERMFLAQVFSEELVGEAIIGRRADVFLVDKVLPAMGELRDLADELVVDGEREDRHAVQAAAGRQHAAAADEAAAGFQAHEIAERGGHPARARGVGAERKADEAMREGQPGTRTRPAADVQGVERVGRRAEGCARAGQPGRELVHVGLADEDSARVRKFVRDGGVVLRDVVFENLR